MSDQRERAFEAWAKFLNPETLRSNLIAASIFLAAYEMLRASVIHHIRDFFCHDYIDGQFIASEEYKSNCLALDKSPLRASLLWLKQMSVIDDKDIEIVDRIREHRNDLAHDLPKFLGTPDAEINVQLLAGIFRLVTKIDRWWIREVEMPTDPDFDGKEIEDGEITSGNMLFIHMMIQIATGEDSGAYWEELKKQALSTSPKTPSGAAK